MIFCRGTRKNLRALIELFKLYGEASGQIISLNKCTFYSGAIPDWRLHSIANVLGVSAGRLPFTYLGVPIFKGKPKRAHLLPIADKIKLKLATWKGSLLSIMGRVQLVKSVIHGMLLYSFQIYPWPVSLLSTIDTWIRNFIWSGDINTRKLVTVAWHQICKPAAEGGLGLRSIRKINEAATLKLCWDFLSVNSDWACFLRARFLKNGFPVQHYVKSSLWPGLKRCMASVSENVAWQLGDGTSINFWRDNWLGDPLVESLAIPASLHHCF